MEVVVERCAFLDLHRDTVMACARTPDSGVGQREEVAESGSVLTKSGRAMIDGLIAGERDTTVLAEMAKGHLRARIPQLEDALAGRFNEHHALIASAMLARIDQTDATVKVTHRAHRRAVGPLRSGGDVAGDDPRGVPSDSPGDPR